MTWFVVIVTLVVIGFLLDREIYFYEGVHLGPRVQSWLYDRWSRKYDQSKRASQEQDGEMLAQPLSALLAEVPAPFVLDFATGTGRLSSVLLNQPDFRGHIVALDLSQGMLEKAALKCAPHRQRVEFLHHRAFPLPFPDHAFDAVCALEVLELFPNMDEPLREFTRVLRPGGVLLSSRGTEQSGRRAKVKSRQDLFMLLERHGYERIEITAWWKLFDRVIAHRRGASNPVESGALADVLRCANCGQIDWQSEAHHWKCRACGHELPVTTEGILLNSL